MWYKSNIWRSSHIIFHFSAVVYCSVIICFPRKVFHVRNFNPEKKNSLNIKRGGSNAESSTLTICCWQQYNQYFACFLKHSLILWFLVSLQGVNKSDIKTILYIVVSKVFFTHQLISANLAFQLFLFFKSSLYKIKIMFSFSVIIVQLLPIFFYIKAVQLFAIF